MRGLSWSRDGRRWPNRRASRFVDAGGLRWHVQVMGHGPALLLVHGIGATTHSFRALMPLLATRFTVIAPDLPGHGFTQSATGRRMSLPGMAAGLAGLLSALGARPTVAVGHSAGAAIVVRMCLDGQIAPARVISLNGALLPLDGLPASVFAPFAGFLASLSPVHPLLAWRADRVLVDRLLAGTGSMLNAKGTALYARLARCPAHVGGALTMMANWDLEPIERDLPRLSVPITLIVGAHDRTIRPSEAERARHLLPSAEIVTLPGLGHLAHEERPRLVAEQILARAAGAPAATPFARSLLAHLADLRTRRPRHT